MIVSNNSVIVIAMGAFGNAVADELSNLRNDCVKLQGDFDVAGLPDARLYLLAAWRPSMAVCTALESRSYQTGKPFVPLVADGAILRL